MAGAIGPQELRRFAELGALTRLETLERERQAILRAFPRLGNGGIKPQPASARKRVRKPMSAAARKAVSARMRQYWASRRKAAKAKH